MKEQNALSHKLEHILRFDRAIRFVWEARAASTIAILGLVVVQGLLPLLSLYLIKLIVDSVAHAVSTPEKAAAFQEVALFVGLAAGVALLSALCQSMADFAKEAQAQTVKDHMYDVLHAKSIEVDLEYYENPEYFDTLHRAQQEGPHRPTQIVNNLVQLGQSSISILAIAALLFSLHWAVALILLVAAVPGLLVRLRYSDRIYAWEREVTGAERKASYLNWLLTGDMHAKEIRLLNLGSLFRLRFSELRTKLRNERLEVLKRRSVAGLLAEAGATVSVFATLGFIGYRAVYGFITLGDMVMFFSAFRRGLSCLQAMLSALAGLYENNLFLFHLFEFLDLEPKIQEPLRPRTLPKRLQEGIVFDHVSFHYPNGNGHKTVLKDVSISIKPGEVVALVGENGSGKTTLVKLLCRLYDPIRGNISLDGVNLREFNTTSLRREISVIFQDYAKYHLTARENIWFGNIDLLSKDERVSAAAHQADADTLIEQLPKGYETILGRMFDGGKELSVGEWQKVALGRAFLRDAQIIVLDEPTSSLDPKAEYNVFQRMRDLLNGRTAILISHRFSTVRMADRIFVLDGGKVVEQGTHEALIREGGRYAKLFERQSQHYR
jgi:ATP-binding cassette subfamily B protein